MSESVSRRKFLASTGVAAVAAVAGCGGGGDGGDGGGDGNTVIAGPGGDLVFDPEEITVSTGETVTWEFDSPNHNVVAWPDMHDEVDIPEGADGFGSMEQGGDAFETVPEGETYSHTFETTGEFTYVCVPHAGSGMIGTVVVE
jgi:plastocyanin